MLKKLLIAKNEESTYSKVVLAPMRANAVLTTSASINDNATDSSPQDKIAYRIIPKYATNMNLEIYGFGTYGSSDFTKWVDIWDNTTEIGDPIQE